MNTSESLGQQPSGCTLLIFGASYARNWMVDEIMGCRVVNKGLGGNQSFEMRDRFETDVIPEKPQYILVWGFINDIFKSDPNKLAETKQGIKENFQTIVSKSRINGIRPILATEITMGNPGGFIHSIVRFKNRVLGIPSYQSQINQHVIEINDWLRKYAERESVPLLDFHKALAEEGGNRKSAFVKEDGSHVSPAGYQALTEYVEGVQNSVLIRE